MAIDEPLQAIVDGSWDRAAYLKKRELEMAAKQRSKKLSDPPRVATHAGDQSVDIFRRWQRRTLQQRGQQLCTMTEPLQGTMTTNIMTRCVEPRFLHSRGRGTLRFLPHNLRQRDKLRGWKQIATGTRKRSKACFIDLN